MARHTGHVQLKPTTTSVRFFASIPLWMIRESGSNLTVIVCKAVSNEIVHEVIAARRRRRS